MDDWLKESRLSLFPEAGCTTRSKSTHIWHPENAIQLLVPLRSEAKTPGDNDAYKSGQCFSKEVTAKGKEEKDSGKDFLKKSGIKLYSKTMLWFYFSLFSPQQHQMGSGNGTEFCMVYFYEEVISQGQCMIKDWKPKQITWELFLVQCFCVIVRPAIQLQWLCKAQVVHHYAHVKAAVTDFPFQIHSYSMRRWQPMIRAKLHTMHHITCLWLQTYAHLLGRKLVKLVIYYWEKMHIIGLFISLTGLLWLRECCDHKSFWDTAMGKET